MDALMLADPKADPKLSTAKAPRRARGEARVAALLDSAERVFAARGYGAATMTEIAAGAGAPIGSLYQFFPAKEAIAGAVLERSVGALNAAFERLLERRLGPAALADALVDVFAPLSASRAVSGALLVDGPDAQMALRSAVRTGLRERLAAVLQAAAPQVDAPRAAQVAVMVLQMSKVTALLPGQAPEVPELEDALRDMLRAALPVWLA